MATPWGKEPIREYTMPTSVHRSNPCLEIVSIVQEDQPGENQFASDAVGTLNQGYPLLQYEGAAPVPHLQVIRRAAPDPTTWAGLGAPRGKER
jgi:hypothetical protein